MKTLKREEYTLTYKDSAEIKEVLFEKLLDFYNRHEAFSGESVAQCDGPQIEAADLLGGIADEIFQFQVDWHE